MKQRTLLAAIGLFAAGAIQATGTHAADAKTESLANTCNACHGMNGVSVGPNMPSIGGLSESYLYAVMQQWKNGERYSATMGRHFKGYSDQELDAIAKYFSQLPWVPVAQNADAKTLARGKEASERCETCHGATGGEPDDADTPPYQWPVGRVHAPGNAQVPHRYGEDAAQENARQHQETRRSGPRARGPALRRPAQIRRHS
jgi:sulfide dehydrogenase cytochrome subunit